MLRIKPGKSVITACILCFGVIAVRKVLCEPEKNTVAVAYKILDLGLIEAAAINNNGQVTGRIADAKGKNHAILYSTQNGKLQILQGLGGVGRDINDAGQVAGSLKTATGKTAAVYWSGGAPTMLSGKPPGLVASSINNFGLVVGWSRDARSKVKASLWIRGKAVDIANLPAYPNSEALAINKRGEILLAAFDDIDLNQHPFVWAGGKLSTIRGMHRVAAINDKGQIAGQIATSKGQGHAALWDRGRVCDIDGRAQGSSDCLSLNNDGKAVGVNYSGISNRPGPRAFIYSDGTMKDLASMISTHSEWELLWATDINDRGQIIGEGLHKGKRRAFLLNPIK